MIVCHCLGITDREIRRIAQETGKSPRAISQRCGAGSECHSCIPTIQSVLRDADARREPRAPRPPRKD